MSQFPDLAADHKTSAAQDIAKILIVPGLRNSGPGHWQSWFEKQLPATRRVEQADWETTCLSDRADAWGSAFLSIGDAGHINVDSGHGPWPDGLALFEKLRRTSRR